MPLLYILLSCAISNQICLGSAMQGYVSLFWQHELWIVTWLPMWSKIFQKLGVLIQKWSNLHREKCGQSNNFRLSEFHEQQKKHHFSVLWILSVRHYNPRIVYSKPTKAKNVYSRFFFLNILAFCIVSIEELFVIKSGL